MIDYCKNCTGMEECEDCEGNIALQVMVEMFFQQFLTVAHFMCPLKLMDQSKETDFRKFLLNCLNDNLIEFELNERENDADLIKKLLSKNENEKNDK